MTRSGFFSVALTRYIFLKATVLMQYIACIFRHIYKEVQFFI